MVAEARMAGDGGHEGESGTVMPSLLKSTMRRTNYLNHPLQQHPQDRLHRRNSRRVQFRPAKT